MADNLLVRFLGVLAIYLALVFLGGEVGQMILYPIHLLVTFLHELGHALGALITGGDVLALQVNEDGSGWTKTQGGNLGIILMGGYLGSALLGNILFYIGANGGRIAKATLFVLMGFMIFAGIMWFNSLWTTGFLLAFSTVLYFLTTKTNLHREILMFLGLATILYIIQDFNVGPSSDLKKYAELLVFIPANVWMYIWLAVAVSLTALNIYAIVKISRRKQLY